MYSWTLFEYWNPKYDTHTYKAQYAIPQHVCIIHIQLDMITSISIEQVSIRSLHRKVKLDGHSFVEIPTHPPLNSNEEDFKGLGLWKEEV